MTTKITVEAFLDYIKQTKSKNTYREYQSGLKKFSKWYGKSSNEILEERRQDWVSGDLFRKKRFSREIEKFHKWLLQSIHTIKGKPDQPYSINSARTYTLGLIQLFRFYEMPLSTISPEVSKRVPTTRDFVPTIAQYRRMFNVAGDLRSKLIISMGKDLAWRIGDFSKIRKDQLPNLDQDAPIEFVLITEKEDIVAKSFLSQETVNLLKQYLPTVESNSNPYLFPSNREGYYDPESINRTLRELAEKANVKIPKNKRLRFHAFRKRFLSECANVRIDVNTAKVLVGKSVEGSMLAYLSEVEHREAFIKVHERLRLTETPMRTTKETATELEKKVERLERIIHGIIALGGANIVERAKQIIETQYVGTLSKDAIAKAKELSPIELLELVGKGEEQNQLEEYKRMIAENNNNQK